MYNWYVRVYEERVHVNYNNNRQHEYSNAEQVLFRYKYQRGVHVGVMLFRSYIFSCKCNVLSLKHTTQLHKSSPKTNMIVADTERLTLGTYVTVLRIHVHVRIVHQYTKIHL